MDIIFLIGPTAAGKSAVAVELAAICGGEIVSADSMQIYRGLDVLPAKPAGDILSRVPHHLIGVCNPDERFDVSLYGVLAREAISKIISRGKTPLVVGGAGMYVRALADGIFEGPGRDPRLRQELEMEADEKGTAFLHGRLTEVDPQAARKIHRNDRRRIVRALEVFYSSGVPLSSQQREWGAGERPDEGGVKWYSRNLDSWCVFLGLRRGRDDLRERIRERVERMFREGAVEEVKRLLSKGMDETATVWQLLGLKEIRGYLEGEYGLEKAKELLARHTMAYARRQYTWFEKDERIRWFDISSGESERVIAERLWKERCW